MKAGACSISGGTDPILRVSTHTCANSAVSSSVCHSENLLEADGSSVESCALVGVDEVPRDPLICILAIGTVADASEKAEAKHVQVVALRERRR